MFHGKGVFLQKSVPTACPLYAFLYIKSFDVCQTYSTKKYTCVYTAVTRDEIDAVLAAIVLNA